MPGMYVVTSTLLVSRARATLRSAELGFLGVCVYTRMHTPRFSGHPCSAGDFVFVRTFSRPLRTSCANVGTALPQTSKKFYSVPGRLITGTRSLGVIQQKGSVATPADRQDSPRKQSTAASTAAGQTERLTRLCGAGAPFRPLSRSVPYLIFRSRETFPFYYRAKIPLTKG